jgi:hypothetical protein
MCTFIGTFSKAYHVTGMVRIPGDIMEKRKIISALLTLAR